MPQLVVNYLAPAFALILALILHWRIPTFDAEQVALLSQLPYLFCILSGLIALFANRARELSLSALMLLSYWVIQNFLQVRLENEPAGQIFVLLSLLLPVLFTVLLFLPDPGWRHPLGIATVLAAPVVTLLLAGIFQLWPLWFKAQAQAMAVDSFLGLKLPAVSAWLFIFGLLASGGLLALRNGKLESSLLGCLLLVFVTLGWFHLQAISATFFSCAGLLLIVNQIHSLLDLVYRDELTQIENRRALLQTARGLGQQYALAMVDIDHFKKINDTHGHELGDQVLKVVAAKLRQVGGGGKAFRYGGEEFCILFKGKHADEVAPKLEALRKAIAEYDMQLRDKQSRPKRQKEGIARRGATRRKGNMRITVSMGLVEAASKGFQDAIQAADAAMYQAKRGGRNQLRVA